MKKLFFILLSLSLIFSNCQQNNPSPSASPPAPPACCTFSASGLNYNPTVLGIDMCDGSIVYTNSNGDITIIVVQFHSYCSGVDNDWIMSAGIDGRGSAIISGTPYNITGTPTGSSEIASFLFYDYNCTQSTVDTYINLPNGNGTLTFNVDLVNNEIGGTFTLTGVDPLGVLPPKTVVCSFQNMPCQIISI